jgi:hypothetical protein
MRRKIPIIKRKGIDITHRINRIKEKINRINRK